MADSAYHNPHRRRWERVGPDAVYTCRTLPRWTVTGDWAPRRDGIWRRVWCARFDGMEFADVQRSSCARDVMDDVEELAAEIDRLHEERGCIR